MKLRTLNVEHVVRSGSLFLHGSPDRNLTYGDTAEKETMETLCHQMRMDTSPRPERVHATEVRRHWHECIIRYTNDEMTSY